MKYKVPEKKRSPWQRSGPGVYHIHHLVTDNFAHVHEIKLFVNLHRSAICTTSLARVVMCIGEKGLT